jgi:hypothetical protein
MSDSQSVIPVILVLGVFHEKGSEHNQVWEQVLIFHTPLPPADFHGRSAEKGANEHSNKDTFHSA